MAKNFPTAAKILLALVVIILVGFPLKLSFLNFYRAAYPVGYEDLVLAQSERTGVPAALIFAVIRTESGFRPGVSSSVNARGLMQITKDTFEWTKYRIKDEENLSFDDLFETSVNIRYGAELLRLLLDEFGSEANALCAYHAGWGSAQSWLSNPEYVEDGQIVVIPFGDTRRYVAKVLETKIIYERLYDLKGQ